MRNIYLILILAAIMLAGCKSKEDSKNKDSRNKEIRKAKSDGLPLQTGEPETAQMTQEKFRKKLVANESFSLTSNLELEGWESVPSYKGKLEGQGKKLTIKSFTDGAIGLIGQIGKESLVKNLEIELAGDLKTSGIAGVLASTNKGRVERVKVGGEGKVKGDEVGGLVGWNEGTIKESSAKVNVIGKTFAGGLVGINFNVIENSYAAGTATSNKSDSNVGGLVGYNQLHVKKSYATGDVEGVAKVGGLVGFSYGTIERSYATGAVKGRVSVGGLVGYNEDATIAGSHATGAVEGGQFAGGLVGEHRSTHWAATIKESYAQGEVTASGDSSIAGGLVGVNSSGKIENSFCLKRLGLNAVGSNAQATGVTAIEQTDIRANTFTAKGWSTSIWSFKASQWPKLAWQP